MSKTTGRNDPCLCGSGKKYKKCCLSQDRVAAGSVDVSRIKGASGAAEEVRLMMEGQQFGSEAEVDAFMHQVSNARNERAIDDFQGLSSEQMHHFLHFPFDCPQYVVFPEVLDSAPVAPLMTLFSQMSNAMGDNGLKATATGNLPRAFCRDAFAVFEDTGFYDTRLRPRTINGEADFTELHQVRVIAELAGLVVLKNKRVWLTDECRNLLAEHGNAAVYPRLFRTFSRQYNWGYLDGYGEVEIVQHSFLFTLYLLQQQYAKPRAHSDLAEQWLQAFPMAADEFSSRPLSDARSQAMTCYTQRALRDYCRMLGLAEVTSRTGSFLDQDYSVKTLPLMYEAVQFQGALKMASNVSG